MKGNRYAKPNATSKRAIHATEAYYRMMAEGANEPRTAPPMGFEALKALIKPKPRDKEAEAERLKKIHEQG